MDHEAKSKFILALHHKSLQAFAQGGTTLSGPTGGGYAANAADPSQSGLFGAINEGIGLNNNFKAGTANLQQGTNAAQLNQGYEGAQSGIKQQQDFSNVAGAQGGFSNQSSVFAQQQALANQLQSQAAGQGPNVAQMQLNQATGQNVANQAALMAGQRGASSNAGLIARQAAQQGANTQQQAAGQAATLQAQQQIAAQGALANQQAQMQGVAANQIGTHAQAVQGVSNTQQNEQNILQGANTNYNNAQVSQQGNVNNVNQQTASANQAAAGQTFGSVLSGVSSLFGGMAQGGMVKKYAEGGPVSGAGQWLNSAPVQSSIMNLGGPSSGPSFSEAGWKGHDFGKGKGSPDPTHINGAGAQGMAGGPMDNMGAASGGMDFGSLGGAAMLAAKGGKVKAGKGEKAVKKDNSYDNDKVPALLSQGEIVIPRSITQHPNAPAMAAQFVQAALNKRRMGTK